MTSDKHDRLREIGCTILIIVLFGGFIALFALNTDIVGWVWGATYLVVFSGADWLERRRYKFPSYAKHPSPMVGVIALVVSLVAAYAVRMFIR